MKQKTGFTLIELLVVVAIIALLVAILVPSLNKAREFASRAVCLSNQHQLAIGVVLYANNNSDQVPPLYDPALHLDFTYILMSNVQGSYSPGGLGLLYSEEYVEVPKSYFCPSSSELIPDTLWPIYGSYYWRFMLRTPSQSLPKLSELGLTSAITSDVFAIHQRLMEIGDPAWTDWYWHNQEGVNVGYSDGSASWYSDSDDEILDRSYNSGAGFASWINSVWKNKLSG